MAETKLPVVLIPSLEPDDRLPAYVADLMASGFSRVVVVNDGSSAAYQPIFDRIAELGATVLGYEVNRGKGYALKHGLRWILEHEPDCPGVLTADADGQHTVPDCLRLAEALAGDGNALWLGSRDFNLPSIPPKSRFGNKCTSVIFKLLYGVWLPDTQTGLRAFGPEEIAFMAEVDGDRYEYEMNVLIACARRMLPIRTLTIETIYEDNNAGTHFHPIRDSWRIYKVILGSFLRFAASSVICFLVDYGLFNLFFYVLFPAMGVSLSAPLFAGLVLDNRSLSNYTARLFSSALNFILNRNVVFRARESRGAWWRYIVTCVAIIVLSTLGIKALGLIGVPAWLAKLLCDTLLYFLSYRIQQRWVFAKPKEGSHA